ncbi:hypothetical protein CHUAL_003936 [Chamberlinius hualienensis]
MTHKVWSSSSVPADTTNASADMIDDETRTCGGVRDSWSRLPRDKPRHLVERRNARERRRVEAVNIAFAQLRKIIPIENRNKRISKVKTLQRAIDYIEYLRQILEDDLQVTSSISKNVGSNINYDYNRNCQNEIARRTNQKLKYDENDLHDDCATRYLP